jgi:hypothetical protein
MVQVTVPFGRRPRRASGVAVYISRVLERDVHPAHLPRRTRIERPTHMTDQIAQIVLPRRPPTP